MTTYYCTLFKKSTMKGFSKKLKKNRSYHSNIVYLKDKSSTHFLKGRLKDGDIIEVHGHGGGLGLGCEYLNPKLDVYPFELANILNNVLDNDLVVTIQLRGCNSGTDSVWLDQRGKTLLKTNFARECSQALAQLGRLKATVVGYCGFLELSSKLKLTTAYSDCEKNGSKQKRAPILDAMVIYCGGLLLSLPSEPLLDCMDGGADDLSCYKKDKLRFEKDLKHRAELINFEKSILPEFELTSTRAALQEVVAFNPNIRVYEFPVNKSSLTSYRATVSPGKRASPNKKLSDLAQSPLKRQRLSSQKLSSTEQLAQTPEKRPDSSIHESTPKLSSPFKKLGM